MPYTSPAAPVSGAVISKTTFGDVVKADLDYLANPPACRVYHNANQSPATATDTWLAFNSERFDTNGMHDPVTNNGRITFVTAGLYIVTAEITWASNATGVRACDVTLNAARTVIASDLRQAVNGNETRQPVATVYKFAAGDYIELKAFQNSGGSLAVVAAGNHSPEFAATWIGLG